jgi:hypothetical protein
MAARMIAMSRNGSIASSPCIMSVNAGSTPRMCIGKKFQSASALTALSAIITASTRTSRVWADTQMPSEKSSIPTLEMVKSGTRKSLVGAPIANSSLTA